MKWDRSQPLWWLRNLTAWPICRSPCGGSEKLTAKDWMKLRLTESYIAESIVAKANPRGGFVPRSCRFDGADSATGKRASCLEGTTLRCRASTGCGAGARRHATQLPHDTEDPSGCLTRRVTAKGVRNLANAGATRADGGIPESIGAGSGSSSDPRLH